MEMNNEASLVGFGCALIGHPFIACSQRCLAVERLQPVVDTNSGPYVHHDLAGSGRDIAGGCVDRLAVHIPCNGILLPVEPISMIPL